MRFGSGSSKAVEAGGYAETYSNTAFLLINELDSKEFIGTSSSDIRWAVESKGDCDCSETDKSESDRDGRECECDGVLEIDEREGKSAKLIDFELSIIVGAPMGGYAECAVERKDPVFQRASYDIGGLESAPWRPEKNES